MVLSVERHRQELAQTLGLDYALRPDDSRADGVRERHGKVGTRLRSPSLFASLQAFVDGVHREGYRHFQEEDGVVLEVIKRFQLDCVVVGVLARHDQSRRRSTTAKRTRFAPQTRIKIQSTLTSVITTSEI